MNTFQEALDNTNTTYAELVAIADDIVSRYATDIDNVIKTASNVQELSNDSLRALMTTLSFKAYSLGEAKEHALLKSECAETLMKEMQAKEFNGTDGTVDTRKNTALLNSSNEILVNMVYETVGALLKTRVDEVHRIVDTLKSVLLSRNSEAKINASITDEREGM